MPDTPKSKILYSKTQPNNVFYIWYSELCCRLNSHPASLVKPVKIKCITILDFPADRLTLEDWSPVINALRHDTSLHEIHIRNKTGNYLFSHEINTEDKARRLKRKYGSIWTDYILNSLVRGLSFTIKNSQVLTCLELDGLPMYPQYLQTLLKALRKNTTIKTFSLTNCPIADEGCRSVCYCVQFMPDVEILNLSGCKLTSESGNYIAKLIKCQQLNRHTTGWHDLYRYEDLDSDKMFGIRRITLNQNPAIGNKGLNYILDELETDSFIKALDMQNCGITDDISFKLLDILEFNRSLKIADFRQNESLSPEIMEQIFGILKCKLSFDEEPEYNWCSTATSIAATRPQSACATNIIHDSLLSSNHRSVVKMNGDPKGVVTSRTIANILRKTMNYGDHPTDTLERSVSKQKIQQLNLQLEQEITKRKETEKENVVLKRKISKINQPIDPVDLGPALKTVMKSLGKFESPSPEEDSCKNNVLSQNHPTNTNSRVKSVMNLKNDVYYIHSRPLSY